MEPVRSVGRGFPGDGNEKRSGLSEPDEPEIVITSYSTSRKILPLEPVLNEREAEYVNALMKWDQRRIQLGWFFMAWLVLGGLVFVFAAGAMLRHMDDATAFSVALPGFALGLLLIALAITGVQWVKQRYLVASIVRKLQHVRQVE
jgi:hypothetical protein